MKRFVRREYEVTALVAVRQERVIVLFWTRRGRKSTTMGSIAFDEMSREAGRTVISASASLLLGTELVNMTVTAAEQAILVANEAQAVHSVFLESAAEQKLQLQLHDAESGKEYKGSTAEDFAGLYVSKRLEMRLYHDKTSYSRQLVIAPNPATARGWRGTVLRDEAGFTAANLELALREAVDPIFRDVPDLKMIYGSNLCRDDRHPFFEMTMPPAGLELPVNPAGNFYRGQDGILIHRVTLKDAYAAGHVLYDNEGKPMTYEEFASQASNRAQMPYNYDLEHKMGGSAAIDLLALLVSQQRGARTCAFVYVDDDADFRRACDLLRAVLGSGKVSIGYDPATTTKQTSNPSGITITEKNGTARAQRLVLCWKEKEPSIVRERMKELCTIVRDRPEGGAPCRLVILATNERLFAKTLADDMAGMVPTTLVIEGEGIHPAGYESAINYKTYLGDLYCAAVNGNLYDLPAGEYFKKDQRATIKSGGRYECDVDPSTGGHGDTFSSGMAAEFGFTAISGAITDPNTIRTGANTLPGIRRPAFTPARLA